MSNTFRFQHGAILWIGDREQTVAWRLGPDCDVATEISLLRGDRDQFVAWRLGPLCGVATGTSLWRDDRDQLVA